MADERIKDRGRANSTAALWYNFIKNNRLSEGEAEQIASSYATLDNFIKTNKLQSDAAAILNAKELARLLEFAPEKNEKREDEQKKEHQQSFPVASVGAAAVAVGVALLIRPEIMEQDPRFQRIEEDLRKKWLKENDANNFNSKEGAAFLYGDPDDPTKLSVMQEAEKEFREKHGNLAAKYEKKKAKVKKDMTKDAAIKDTSLVINLHQQAITTLADSDINKLKKKDREKLSNEDVEKLRSQKLKELGYADEYSVLMQRIKDKQWAEFVRKYPEKAAAYAASHPKDTHAQETQKQIATAHAVATGDNKKLNTLSDTEFDKAHKAYAEARGKNKAVQERFAKIRKAQLAKAAQSQEATPAKPTTSASRENRMKQAIQNKTSLERKKKEEEGQKKKEEAERKKQEIVRQIRMLQARTNRVSRATTRGTNFVNRNAGRAGRFLSNPLQSIMSGAQNMLKRGAGRMGAQAGRFAAQGLARLAPLLANPVTWIVIGIIIIIIIVFIIIFSTADQTTQKDNKKDAQVTGLSISLKGPNAVQNGENITYQVFVAYGGPGTITLTDVIPENTSFVSATGTFTTQKDANGKVQSVSWAVSATSSQPQNASTSPTFAIILHPEKNDIVVINKVFLGQANGAYSSISGTLLPTAPLPDTAESLKAKQAILNILSKHPENVNAYKEAERETGIPWQVLAGVHFVEGGASPNKSLVSGREIGTVEPDIAPGRNGDSCSSERSGRGIPIPIDGGCGFASLTDSAIYAGNHLKQKVGGTPKNFAEIITALSRYNGGGNANCDEQVPYATQENCPTTRVNRLGSTVPAPPFEGDDDPYAMNYFDTKHENMYLIYCADLTKCNPPQTFKRPGIMTIVRGLL